MFTVQIPTDKTLSQWVNVTKADGTLCEYKRIGNARNLAREMVNLLSHTAARIVSDGMPVETIMAEESVETVTMAKAVKIKAGIFIADDSQGRPNVSVFLFDRTTYVNGPFRDYVSALTDARRVGRMYTKFRIYRVAG